MKIIFFSMNQEEKSFVEQWMMNTGHHVTMVKESLNHATIEWVKGHDAIVLCELYPFPETLYQQLAQMGIKQIAQRSAGMDMYDPTCATKHGIILTNVPSYSPASIAEYNVLAALQMIRKSERIQDHVAMHDFRWHAPILGKTLRQMTVGLVGVGKIGRFNAMNFHGMGARVLGYDIKPNPELASIVEYQPNLKTLMHQSDIVVLQVPLKKDTYHMINRESLSWLRPNSYLLNMARGGVVDTQAVIDALDNGQLAHAALDTYEFEPGYVMNNWKDRTIEDALFNQILNHPKITYSPHIAYYTEESVQNLVEGALDSAVEVVKTGTATNRVN